MPIRKFKENYYDARNLFQKRDPRGVRRIALLPRRDGGAGADFGVHTLKKFYRFIRRAAAEHIIPIDKTGITMAAIQDLSEELDERLTTLKRENDRLKSKVENQQRQIDALVKIICATSQTADVCRQP